MSSNEAQTDIPATKHGQNAPSSSTFPVKLLNGKIRRCQIRTNLDLQELRKNKQKLDQDVNPCKGGEHHPFLCKHSCDADTSKHIGRCLHDLHVDGFTPGPTPCSIRCLKPKGDVDISIKTPSCLTCDSLYIDYGFWPMSAQIRDFVTYGRRVQEYLENFPEQQRSLIEQGLNVRLLCMVDALSDFQVRVRKGMLSDWTADEDWTRRLHDLVEDDMHDCRRLSLEGFRQTMDSLADQLEQERFELGRLFPDEATSTNNTRQLSGIPDLGIQSDILTFLRFEEFTEEHVSEADEFITDLLGCEGVNDRLRTQLDSVPDTGIFEFGVIRTWELAHIVASCVRSAIQKLEPGLTETTEWLAFDLARSYTLLNEAIVRGTNMAALTIDRLVEQVRDVDERTKRIHAREDAEEEQREEHLQNIDDLLKTSAPYWLPKSIHPYVCGLLAFFVDQGAMDPPVGYPERPLGEITAPPFFAAELAAQVGATPAIRARCQPVFDVIRASQTHNIMHHKYPVGARKQHVPAVLFVVRAESKRNLCLRDMSEKSIGLLCRLLRSAQVQRPAINIQSEESVTDPLDGTMTKSLSISVHSQKFALEGASSITDQNHNIVPKLEPAVVTVEPDPTDVVDCQPTADQSQEMKARWNEFSSSVRADRAALCSSIPSLPV